ncbi:hypothetical protein DSM3645_23096 [Blastopirellula marina DSM 3645]|uniref:Uncharacterized protein n=1 Tax=Blastopirellula marina DSM 3645 TaxID=314230 RepID=A3ZQ56_9BACT|nr:hypothetical protein DSM3645_23096 [Blastopirellula marina DSM 3645]
MLQAGVEAWGQIPSACTSSYDEMKLNRCRMCHHKTGAAGSCPSGDQGPLLARPATQKADSAKKQARLLGTVAPMNGIIARITVSTGGASWWVLEVEAANDRVELR